MTRAIGVLVVDDSAFVRKAIARMMASDPAIEVVGQAEDGESALRLAEALRPDVVTLDLEMPGMGGLAALAALRERGAMPVIVLSGAAEAGAAVTLQALDLGAFDVVAKPSGGPLAIHGLAAELVAKVRAAAGRPAAEGQASAAPAPAAAGRPDGTAPARPPQPFGARRARGDGAIELVVIGVSTGGPPALQHLMAALPAGFPAPIVVAQHMPPGYTRALAERLDRLSPLAVREAADGDALRAGEVLVAPSGRQLGFRRGHVVVTDECPIASYYRPCIDWAFRQAADAYGAGVLAVVMTGMGQDGAAGVREVKAARGQVWAQDEATSAIWGMPRAAAETGCVDHVFGLPDLAGLLAAAVRGQAPLGVPEAAGMAPPTG